MAAIHIENVSKVYKASLDVGKWFNKQRLMQQSVDTGPPEGEAPEGVRALDHLNLFVPNATTTAVVGPSGCGKSTLLRVVAGLTDYEGLVTYDDRDMNEVSPGERLIGMVFQSYALYPHFRGRGNLSFYFRMKRAPDEEAEERIRITSDMMGFGFAELLKRKPGTLSGGQQQRLAIARALVRQPELFLFDEPLSNLDAKLRARTRTEIKRLLHRFEITALYVTHDQTEARALGDDVAVMRAGRIEQIGAFNDILAEPVNLFVAGFLGLPPMNLIQAIVSDGQLVVDETHKFPLPAAVAHHLRNHQRVTIGIRPEAARVWSGSEAADSDDFVFGGTIDVVEPDFGRRQQVAYISAGSITYSVIAPLDIRLTQGYGARVLFPAASIYYFDTETEARIAVR